MGKAVAAWLMVVSAMATTTSSPRDVVQAAVTRVVAVLQNDFEASPLDRPRTEMRRAEIRRIAAELFDFENEVSDVAHFPFDRKLDGAPPLISLNRAKGVASSREGKGPGRPGVHVS